VTGRNEKISDVINVFNAPPPTDEFKPAPVGQITITVLFNKKVIN
jgi:hypothetical protein